jgi:hypothetical protein
MIRSEVLWLLYCTDHMAVSTFITFASRYSTIRLSFGRIMPIVLYRTHGHKNLILVLSWNSTLLDSFRWIGSIVRYTSHFYNYLHFISFKKFGNSCFFQTNRFYCTVHITWLKQTSVLLIPIFRNLLCTEKTTYRHSFPRIGNIVLYSSPGYNYLHLSCVQKLELGDPFPRIYIIILYRSHGYNNLHFRLWYFTNHTATKPSFKVFPEIRLFVIRYDEFVLLYCTNRKAMKTSFQFCKNFNVS